MGCVWKAWKKDIWDLPAEFDRTVICTNEGFQMDAAGGDGRSRSFDNPGVLSRFSRGGQQWSGRGVWQKVRQGRSGGSTIASEALLWACHG